ncbi:hypothetical protein [Trichormus azollae]|uniref:hypothetical protein n=1 Tax=Trichormus azollae TaxID=1164 RepID=UPI00325E8B8D
MMLIAKRHYAICLVLWGLALRRQEIYQLNVSDFNFYRRKLWVFGKRKVTNEEDLDIMSKDVAAAIADLH